MNKKNISITALAAALVLAMAAWSFAGPGYGHGRSGCGGPGAGGGPDGVYSQLTPEKQAAVQAIFDKYAPKFSAMRDQMWAKHSVLQAMINGGDANEVKITKLTSDISKLRDQMWDLRTQMSDELVKETGITAFGGFGGCPSLGQADCPGGRGGRGMGRDRDSGFGPGMY